KKVSTMSIPAAFQAITVQAVQAALSTKTLGRALHLLGETSSTNTIAVALAQGGAPDGTVVIAESQTAGRGRLGRQWHSPPGKNLYCSIILRAVPTPDRVAQWLSWVPLISAMATARAIQVRNALRPSVKWPNDILIGRRKVAGLLCESGGWGTPLAFVVVGIGINVNSHPETFPPNLRELATSMAAEAGRPFDRAALLATLLSELEIRCETFLLGRPTDVMQEYLARCSTLGQR
ncbi:MAG: biotin--[acetyl-CoA-carboxylase] ligase, partial [Nitrospiraceae bacterium]